MRPTTESKILVRASIKKPSKAGRLIPQNTFKVFEDGMTHKNIVANKSKRLIFLYLFISPFQYLCTELKVPKNKLSYSAMKVNIYLSGISLSDIIIPKLIKFFSNSMTLLFTSLCSSSFMLLPTASLVR